MSNDSSSFDDLPDNLSKEAPVGFFDTESQQRQLALLAEYVSHPSRGPIFITGPPGFGKRRWYGCSWRVHAGHARK